jgi:hypothetical protein
MNIRKIDVLALFALSIVGQHWYFTGNGQAVFGIALLAWCYASENV